METRVTKTFLRAGQPRAYADSEYVGRLFIEIRDSTDDEWRPATFVESVVKETYAPLVHSFWKQKDDEKREWWQSYLDYIRKEGPGLWEVRIVSPYTD